MPGHTVQPFSEVFLCCQQIVIVFFHRRQHAQITLYPAVVVVGDVILNRGNKRFPAREAFTIVPFSFQNTAASFSTGLYTRLCWGERKADAPSAQYRLTHLRMVSNATPHRAAASV